MEEPHSLKSNEMAECCFQLQQPLVCDSFKNCEGFTCRLHGWQRSGHAREFGTHPWIQLGQYCRRSDAWTLDFYIEAAATIHAGLVWNASMGRVRPVLSEICCMGFRLLPLVLNTSEGVLWRPPIADAIGWKDGGWACLSARLVAHT